MYPSIEGSLKTDDLVYRQLPEFRRWRELFLPVYALYAGHLNRLMHYYGSFEPDSLSLNQTLRYLRVLSVLRFYYDDDIPHLDVNFNAALKRFPDSKQLADGYRWFKSQKPSPLPKPRTL